MTAPIYQIQIDWDGDGDYGDYGEDVTGRTFGDTGISIRRGRDQIRVLAPPAAGSCQFEIDNTNNDFSPDYPEGPLYGELVPGRTVQVNAGTSGSVRYREPGMTYREPGVPYWGGQYPLFTGVLDDLPQHPELGRRSVSVTALGPLSTLAGRTVSTGLYFDVTTDVALGHLLDAAGWPVDRRLLFTGQTTLEAFWVDEQDAFAAAVEIVNSEGPGASLYEDGAGNIVFEDRNFRATAVRATVPQTTFYTAAANTEPMLSPPISYNPRLQDVINSASSSRRSVASVGAQVASSLTPISIAANQTRTLLWRSPDGYLAAGATGLSLTITSGAITSSAILRASGATVQIRLTAGPAGAELSNISLSYTGYAVTESAGSVTNATDTSESIARYGRRPYSQPMRREISANVLQDLMDAIVVAYMEPRPVVELRVVGANEARLNQIFRRQISDRVNVVDQLSKFAGHVYIERIDHRITHAGRLHETVFGCERAGALIYSVWGTAVWDTSLWGF